MDKNSGDDDPVDVARLAEAFINQDTIHEPKHDEIVWALRTRRDAQAALMPEWEQLREIASQIKEHTLTHLDTYLEQFEQNAIAHGAIVHWAQDGLEHNQIVHRILSEAGVHTLMKSKSMLQEECAMTPYLEERGIKVTESDLGERIQQLAGERPSHIVMPCIHKTKQDIAKLFGEKIGTDPHNDDVHFLCDAMRNNARPKFLAAQAAMTGANFAVAESGTFVVATNEGNADLGVALAPLHIASIGIEKLVPTIKDLAVFVRLLSRSAVGTPMTQYTSHFTGPRPGGVLHIVLVDNGRSRRLGMKEFWTSLKCIRCGACMNTCPVYRRAGGLSYGATYSGPIGVILDPTFDEKKYSELPFHSTVCGSCTEVCPVKINISDQILKWRRVMAEKGYLPTVKKLAIAAGGSTMNKPTLFHILTEATTAVLRHTPDALVYNKSLNAWGRHRDMPPLPKQSFRQWYLKNRSKS